MALKILKATVIQRRLGTDIVYLDTNLPDCIVPPDGNLDLMFHCAKGAGVEYVKKYFPGIEIKIVDTTTGEAVRFSKEKK